MITADTLHQNLLLWLWDNSDVWGRYVGIETLEATFLLPGFSSDPSGWQEIYEHMQPEATNTQNIYLENYLVSSEEFSDNSWVFRVTSRDTTSVQFFNKEGRWEGDFYEDIAL